MGKINRWLGKALGYGVYDLEEALTLLHASITGVMGVGMALHAQRKHGYTHHESGWLGHRIFGI